MPIGLPANRWMLEVGAFVLRTETELIIKSRRVVPARLIETGFQFRFPELVMAVEDLEHQLSTAQKSQNNVLMQDPFDGYSFQNELSLGHRVEGGE